MLGLRSCFNLAFIHARLRMQMYNRQRAQYLYPLLQLLLYGTYNLNEETSASPSPVAAYSLAIFAATLAALLGPTSSSASARLILQCARFDDFEDRVDDALV